MVTPPRVQAMEMPLLVQRLAQAREAQRAARVDAHTALAVNYETLAAAHQEVTTLDRSILPDAREALDTAQDAYSRGRFRLTDVLDTQRTLFELRGRRVAALATYHQALIELERLIGEPLVTSEEQ